MVKTFSSHEDAASQHHLVGVQEVRHGDGVSTQTFVVNNDTSCNKFIACKVKSIVGESVKLAQTLEDELSPKTLIEASNSKITTQHPIGETSNSKITTQHPIGETSNSKITTQHPIGQKMPPPRMIAQTLILGNNNFVSIGNYKK